MTSRNRTMQNFKTAAKSPQIALQYAVWRFRQAVYGENVTKRVNGVLVGGFIGFSEYRSVDAFLSDSEYAFFQNYNFGDGAFIDVGANIGVHSIMLASRYPERPVFAVEANPNTLPSLRANLARNGAQNVVCIDKALSDQEGTVLFNADPIARGTAKIVTTTGEHAVSVQATSLDKLVIEKNIKEIAAIKIDVEGYEIAVLRGAAETLSRLRPRVIFLEVCPALTVAAGFEPDKPLRLLASAGYAMMSVNARGELASVDIEGVHRLDYVNWVALRQ